MAAISPVLKEKAPTQLHDIYEKLTHVFGRMPNIFATAQRPESLQHFLPLDSAIINHGTVELTLVTCVANFTNRLNDALQLQPDLG